jgi:hypothetical protein
MKTKTFNEITIGNIFYMKNKIFIKMNKDQAINENNQLITINASQYVTKHMIYQ